MFAVTAARIDADDPLAGLELGEHAEPAPPDGWTIVTVKAVSLNHHDVWTLRGVGISADRLPIVLGCDAAGLDPDGREVVVHAVVADPDAGGGDETLDPGRSLLSERYDGTFAQRVAVPRRNLVPKPAALSFEQAACLPTAYLTAYRMLFGRTRLEPGATVRRDEDQPQFLAKQPQRFEVTRCHLARQVRPVRHEDPVGLHGRQPVAAMAALFGGIHQTHG